jgi:hypothetical protein
MDQNIRIAIIGGGPAGLSAGMYLEKKGYFNYEIFEKEAYVGGKCHSPVYNGRRYETGAIMGAPTYFAVHEVEEFCGITHDGPSLIREYKDKNGNNIEPFNPKKNPLQLPRLLKMKTQVKTLAELLETKYKGYDVNGHRGVAEGRYDGYAATVSHEKIEGHNENLKDLALPFREFCARNGVDLIQDIWIGPYTAFGYGYFDDIPAAYVLKYLDFATTMYFVNQNLWTWKDGTQSIWEHLNEKLKHQARCSSDITKVERKDGKVYLTVNGKTETFDKLIVTSPLQYFDQYADIREDEKSHFAKIDYERYDVLGVETKPEDHPDLSYYVFENMAPERYGHLMVCYNRWRDDINQPITTYALRNRKGAPEIPFDVCKKTVLSDLRTMHNPPANVIYEKSWYYFPHIYSEDYAAGWYDEVEAMQDKYDTFYAGEIMSFGDMEETCEYSRDLIERFFR